MIYQSLGNMPAERALLFQWQEGGGSPVLSGTHGSSSANSLIFSVPSLIISFTFLLHCKPGSPRDPLHTSCFSSIYLEISGLAGKIRCKIGVLLTSPPGHSFSFLSKILWFWISNHLSILHFTSSCCNRPPNFNSWLTSLSSTQLLSSLSVTSKSRWMILPVV